MLSDAELLKRLQDKGWNSGSLRGRMENGTTALMAALSSIQWERGSHKRSYQDHDLVEALLQHPSTNIHARDQYGRNALWYCDDVEHAFPLLAKAGIDFNQLDNSGQHFLFGDLFGPYGCDLDDPIKLALTQRLIEVGVECGGIDLLFEVQGKPLWRTLPDVLIPFAEALMAKNLQMHLNTLPDAQKSKTPSKKL